MPQWNLEGEYIEYFLECLLKVTSKQLWTYLYTSRHAGGNVDSPLGN